SPINSAQLEIELQRHLDIPWEVDGVPRLRDPPEVRRSEVGVRRFEDHRVKGVEGLEVVLESEPLRELGVLEERSVERRPPRHADVREAVRRRAQCEGGALEPYRSFTGQAPLRIAVDVAIAGVEVTVESRIVQLRRAETFQVRLIQGAARLD